MCIRDSAKDIVEIRKIKANLVSIHVDQLVDQGYLSRIDAVSYTHLENDE